MSVDTIGPFNNGPHYDLVVDGCKVPFMEAHLRKGTEDIWDIILDNRMLYELTDRELRNVLPLLANAMAIAGGYTCFGKNARPINRFQSEMRCITSVETGEE